MSQKIRDPYNLLKNFKEEDLIKFKESLDKIAQENSEAYRGTCDFENIAGSPDLGQLLLHVNHIKHKEYPVFYDLCFAAEPGDPNDVYILLIEYYNEDDPLYNYYNGKDGAIYLFEEITNLDQCQNLEELFSMLETFKRLIKRLENAPDTDYVDEILNDAKRRVC